MIHPGYEVVRISPLASWVTWSLAGWPSQTRPVYIHIEAACLAGWPSQTRPVYIHIEAGLLADRMAGWLAD